MKAMAQLSHFLSSSQSIEELKLRNCHLEDSHVTILQQALTTPHYPYLSSLNSLDLSNNKKIGELGMKAVAKLIQSQWGHTKLKSLNLSGLHSVESGGFLSEAFFFYPSGGSLCELNFERCHMLSFDPLVKSFSACNAPLLFRLLNWSPFSKASLQFKPSPDAANYSPPPWSQSLYVGGLTLMRPDVRLPLSSSSSPPLTFNNSVPSSGILASSWERQKINPSEPEVPQSLIALIVSRLLNWSIKKSDLPVEKETEKDLIFKFNHLGSVGNFFLQRLAISANALLPKERTLPPIFIHELNLDGLSISDQGCHSLLQAAACGHLRIKILSMKGISIQTDAAAEALGKALHLLQCEEVLLSSTSRAINSANLTSCSGKCIPVLLASMLYQKISKNCSFLRKLNLDGVHLGDDAFLRIFGFSLALELHALSARTCLITSDAVCDAIEDLRHMQASNAEWKFGEGPMRMGDVVGRMTMNGQSRWLEAMEIGSGKELANLVRRGGGQIVNIDLMDNKGIQVESLAGELLVACRVLGRLAEEESDTLNQEPLSIYFGDGMEGKWEHAQSVMSRLFSLPHPEGGFASVSVRLVSPSSSLLNQSALLPFIRLALEAPTSSIKISFERAVQSLPLSLPESVSLPLPVSPSLPEEPPYFLSDELLRSQDPHDIDYCERLQSANLVHDAESFASTESLPTPSPPSMIPSYGLSGIRLQRFYQELNSFSPQSRLSNQKSSQQINFGRISASGTQKMLATSPYPVVSFPISQSPVSSCAKSPISVASVQTEHIFASRRSAAASTIENKVDSKSNQRVTARNTPTASVRDGNHDDFYGLSSSPIVRPAGINSSSSLIEKRAVKRIDFSQKKKENKIINQSPTKSKKSEGINGKVKQGQENMFDKRESNLRVGILKKNQTNRNTLSNALQSYSDNNDMIDMNETHFVHLEILKGNVLTEGSVVEDCSENDGGDIQKTSTLINLSEDSHSAQFQKKNSDSFNQTRCCENIQTDEFLDSDNYSSPIRRKVQSPDSPNVRATVNLLRDGTRTPRDARILLQHPRDSALERRTHFRHQKSPNAPGLKKLADLDFQRIRDLILKDHIFAMRDVQGLSAAFFQALIFRRSNLTLLPKNPANSIPIDTSHLRIISLVKCGIDDSSLAALIDCLSSPVAAHRAANRDYKPRINLISGINLEKLDLSHNQISSKGAKIIASRLIPHTKYMPDCSQTNSIPCVPLRSLKLNGNEMIKAAGVIAIFYAIQRLLKSKNKSSTQSAENDREMLKEEELGCSLRSIEISSCGLTHTIGSVIRDVLSRRICHLEHLDISLNPLGDECVLGILHTVASNPRMRVLDVSFTWFVFFNLFYLFSVHQ